MGPNVRVINIFSTEFVFDESGGNIIGFCLAEITLNKKPERKILRLYNFFRLRISFSGTHLFLIAAVGIVVRDTSLKELKHGWTSRKI